MAYDDPIRVKLADLPDSVVEDVRRQTGDYVVPIIIDYTPRGTGTLVQIDNSVGILTAEHVVRHPSNPKLRLAWTGHPERFLRTALGPFAHDISIPTNALQIITSARDTDQYGPDLAFVVLPASPFLGEIKARKSFYNLSLKIEERKTEALKDLGFFALCGFPAVKNFGGSAEFGFTFTQGLYGYSMLTGSENYEIKGKWDYFEIGVSQQSANEFERTFGGVSGGAVWRCLLKREAKAPIGSEYLDHLTFAGVAFYEMDDQSQPRFYIRAHGPKSVYENLISLVRKELS